MSRKVRFLKFFSLPRLSLPVIVPPKLKGRKRNRDQIKPLSGLNVEELLGREKKAKITRENAIPEFKQMLDTAEDPNVISEAAKQLSKIIENQIKDSFGDKNYGQAVAELDVLREEMIQLEEPDIYNDIVVELKRKLLAEELGGDRLEMWWQIKKSRLGLIEKGAVENNKSPRSKITMEEAKLVRLSSFFCVVHVMHR